MRGYLGGLLANTSVAPGNDNDLPGQVRNVVDRKLGLWGEITFDNRIEHLSEDAEGGEKASARHV